MDILDLATINKHLEVDAVRLFPLVLGAWAVGRR